MQVGMGFWASKTLLTAVYSNASDSNLFLDKNKLSYMGGLLEMANNRLYPFWNFLEEGLRRGLLR